MSLFLKGIVEFGLSLGVGLGVPVGLFIYLGMVTEQWLENRKALRIRKNSTRRPPSISGNTEPIPMVIPDGVEHEL